MRKAIFLDRDGTINHDLGYCHKISELKIYQDAAKLVKKFKKLGYLIIVISNQSGIDRGYFTESDMKKFNTALNRRLGGAIDAFYWCPHTPEEKCTCRKPKTALVEKAVQDFGINLKESLVLGDRDDIDGEMARRLKIKYSILPRTDDLKVPQYAIVLAGGKGVRLRSISKKLPKPLVKIRGRPVLYHVLDNLVRNGVHNIIICTGHKGAMIRAHIEKHYKGDANIIYSYSRRMIDTGTRVRLAIKKISPRDKDVAVLFGDDVNEINLEDMYDFHKRKHAPITVAVKHVENVSGFGVVNVSGTKVVSFVEKPESRARGLVNCGVHILSRDAFKYIPKNADFNLTKDFLPRATKLGLVYAYVSKDRWLPIDTPERYENARRSLK